MRQRAMLRMTMILVLMPWVGTARAQDVLPFPTPPMGGKVGPTMQESVHKWRVQPRHLPRMRPTSSSSCWTTRASGSPSTFGGEIETRRR
jgi:hypothetical protein